MNIAIAQAIIWFGTLFMVLIVARAVMSWFPMQHGGIVATLFGLIGIITEPFVSPVRRLLHNSPLGGGGMMIDFAPLITMLLMRFLTTFLANFIAGM